MCSHPPDHLHSGISPILHSDLTNKERERCIERERKKRERKKSGRKKRQKKERKRDVKKCKEMSLLEPI